MLGGAQETGKEIYLIYFHHLLATIFTMYAPSLFSPYMHPPQYKLRHPYQLKLDLK